MKGSTVCLQSVHSVNDMTELFNKVSNSGCSSCSTGNSLMGYGDRVMMAIGDYSCSGGTCATSKSMLTLEHLYGNIKCLRDGGSCVVDGENTRRGVYVTRTGGRALSLRSITFKDGKATSAGGGIYIHGGAIVDLLLCTFSNCRASGTTKDWHGGGAIYISSNVDNTVNLYGTSFNENEADSSKGDDIHNNGGTITIHNTCPSPYSSVVPSKGKLRMRLYIHLTTIQILTPLFSQVLLCKRTAPLMALDFHIQNATLRIQPQQPLL